MRVRALLGGLLVLVVAALPGALPATAHAQEAPPAVAVGWWTSAQLAGLPVGLAATVPQGGLQVANASNGPVSIAAVRFAVPAGSAADLTLALAPGSTGETATVVACPTTKAWEPVRAGKFADAPTWDCSLGSPSGAYDPTARTMTWSFDPTLVRDGVVDVMLLPVQGGLPFNITTDAPTADALRFTAAPPVDDGSSPSPSSSPSTTEPVSAAATGAHPVAPRAPAPRTQTTVPGLASAIPATPPTTEGAAAPPVPTVTVRRPSRLGRPVGIALVAGALAFAVLLWRRREGDPSGRARGVGRFKDERDAPAVPI